MYDLIIVGGGPAGATLARLIGKSYKVLLLEKRTFISKCCGGLIAPDAQLMLARFGLGIPKSVLLSPQLFAVRTIDIDNSLERYYQRFYINVDRGEFDKWLLSIIPAGVDIICGSLFRSFSMNPDGMVDVKYHFNGKDYVEKCRVLVGADGAFSRVRKQGFGDHPAPQLYISIQEWFETAQNADYYGAIFDREITDFYSWTIPKEKYLILGSALKLGNDVYDKFELLKQKLHGFGFSFGDSVKAVKKEGAYLSRPTNTGQICAGSGSVALVGEAAGLISPSSAEGISYAFKSSLALAKALDKGLEGYHKEYLSLLRFMKRNILFKNIKSPAMYNKHLRKAIMKTGIQSVDFFGRSI